MDEESDAQATTVTRLLTSESALTGVLIFFPVAVRTCLLV